MSYQETSLWAFLLADIDGNKDKVLAYLRMRGPKGSTDDEGWRNVGMIKDSYAPARHSLVKEGKVVKTQERRETQAGRKAIVWRAVDHA